MLHYSTVEPGTLVLLNELMLIPELKNFYLVGGTNLSLRYGHRKSDDIDLFSNIDFDPYDIKGVLENNFGLENNTYRPTSIGLFAYINGVKLDLIRNHFHPNIFPSELIDGIRFYDARDIAAMKIFTILKRGMKKDFWDLCQLLNFYTLDEIINYYQTKYSDQNLLITVPQAIIYFEDAEQSQDPISLKGQTWENVKKSLRRTVNDFLKL